MKCWTESTGMGSDQAYPPPAPLVNNDGTTIARPERRLRVAKPPGGGQKGPQRKCFACARLSLDDCSKCGNHCCNMHIDDVTRQCVTCSLDKANTEVTVPEERKRAEREQRVLQRWALETINPMFADEKRSSWTSSRKRSWTPAEGHVTG